MYVFKLPYYTINVFLVLLLLHDVTAITGGVPSTVVVLLLFVCSPVAAFLSFVAGDPKTPVISSFALGVVPVTAASFYGKMVLVV